MADVDGFDHSARAGPGPGQGLQGNRGVFSPCSLSSPSSSSASRVRTSPGCCWRGVLPAAGRSRYGWRSVRAGTTHSAVADRRVRASPLAGTIAGIVIIAFAASCSRASASRSPCRWSSTDVRYAPRSACNRSRSRQRDIVRACPGVAGHAPAVMPAIKQLAPVYVHRRFTLRNLLVAGRSRCRCSCW